MVLVHDDDLARVAKSRESDVSEHLYVSSVLIFSVTGDFPVRNADGLSPKDTARDTADQMWSALISTTASPTLMREGSRRRLLIQQ